MRRTLASVLVAATAVVALGGVAPSASAVCGGGAPGEPCYCPNELDLGKLGTYTLYYC